MKKLTISLLAVIFSISAAISQPVSDMGIIPVGVTLNSILRLNITSGGNLEFIINNIAQYNTGIDNSDIYDTHFTVASSVDFDVEMYGDGDFVGVETGGTIALGNLGYTMTEEGTGTSVGETGGDDNWTLTPDEGAVVAEAAVLLTNASGVEIIEGGVNSAGSTAQNAFIVNWRFGTLEGTLVSNTTSLLEQNISSDRYVANVYVHLYPHN